MAIVLNYWPDSMQEWPSTAAKCSARIRCSRWSWFSTTSSWSSSSPSTSPATTSVSRPRFCSNAIVDIILESWEMFAILSWKSPVPRKRDENQSDSFLTTDRLWRVYDRIEVIRTILWRVQIFIYDNRWFVEGVWPQRGFEHFFKKIIWNCMYQLTSRDQ